MSVLFDCNYHTLLFAAVGFVVVFFFLLDTLWGSVQLLRAILAPFFLPHEETTLRKKYGSWACKWVLKFGRETENVKCAITIIIDYTLVQIDQNRL